MLTPWGYEVEQLPDLITPEEFNVLTKYAYEDDDRVSGAIAAASASIRNYCGWHVSPALACTYTCDGQPGDLWLPCVALSSVDSVTFDGTEQTVRGFNRYGRVRTAATQPSGLGNVTATYVAGFDASLAPDLLDIIKDRVIACIALGYGVASESADGVSVSYSTNATADSGGAFLSSAARVALAPYRLVSAHAA